MGHRESATPKTTKENNQPIVPCAEPTRRSQPTKFPSQYMLLRDGGIALIKGCSEKRIWGMWQFYYGIVEGQTAGKGRDQSGLGGNKHGKTRRRGE